MPPSAVAHCAVPSGILNFPAAAQSSMYKNKLKVIVLALERTEKTKLQRSASCTHFRASQCRQRDASDEGPVLESVGWVARGQSDTVITSAQTQVESRDVK